MMDAGNSSPKVLGLLCDPPWVEGLRLYAGFLPAGVVVVQGTISSSQLAQCTPGGRSPSELNSGIMNTTISLCAPFVESLSNLLERLVVLL